MALEGGPRRAGPHVEQLDGLLVGDSGRLPASTAGLLQAVGAVAAETRTKGMTESPSIRLLDQPNF
jgi:hypothetical protein